MISQRSSGRGRVEEGRKLDMVFETSFRDLWSQAHVFSVSLVLQQSLEA